MANHRIYLFYRLTENRQLMAFINPVPFIYLALFKYIWHYMKQIENNIASAELIFIRPYVHHFAYQHRGQLVDHDSYST